MATAVGAFDVWLTEKLTSLSPEFDTDVFVSYIISMLDTDTLDEDTTDGIEEFLSQVLDEDKSKAACKEIAEQWQRHNGEALAAAANAVKTDAADVLSRIMEQQTLATVKENKLTAEQQAHKQAILLQYSQVSEGEDSDDEPVEAASGPKKDPLLERNINASSVDEALQAMREHSKEESAAKKEKDKADREAQRLKQQNRKETEKKRTQKGEKRR